MNPTHLFPGYAIEFLRKIGEGAILLLGDTVGTDVNELPAVGPVLILEPGLKHTHTHHHHTHTHTHTHTHV